MRVLYVIDSLAPGGAETSLAAMAPGLVRGGIDLHVLPLSKPHDLAPALRRAGVVLHGSGRGKRRLDRVRSVIRTARLTKPDLIHTTLYEADVAGRLAARLLQLPATTSLVNDSYSISHYAETSRVKLHAARILDAATATFATRFHAISTAIADSVPPRIGVSRAIVDVIPRGRNPREFPFRPPELRRRTRLELGITAASPVILAVGRLEPQKGIQHLLTALPAVAHHHPNLVTLIAGRDGRASESLRHLSTRSHTDVRFLGHRPDVAGLLAAADVLCFPSEREGFGGVLIEGLAVGCPIVASAISTSQEVLGVGEPSVGILTPTGDADQLARALIQVLNGPEAAADRARRGRIRFEALYTLGRVVDRMIMFYYSCLGRDDWKP